MIDRVRCVLCLVLLLGCRLALAVPPPDEDDPPPADEPTPAEMRGYVFQYLQKKTGPAVPATLRRTVAWSQCVDQYDAALKAGNPAAILGLIHSHLKAAEQRIKDRDIGVQREGVAIAAAAGRCAVFDLKDHWLGAHVAEAFLMPHIDVGDDRPNQQFSRMEFVQYARVILAESGETKRSIKACRRYLEMAEGFTDNAADAARVHLAVALETDGQLEEAVKVLERIDPKGSLSGSRKDLLVRVKAKLDKKAAAKPINK